MKSNQPMGQYVNDESFLHKIDPRIKFMANIILITNIFLVSNYLILLSILVILVLTYFLSKLKFRTLLSILITSLVFSLLTLFFNSILINESKLDQTLYLKFSTFTISSHIIQISILIFLRIILMIIITTLLTSTTKPLEISHAIEDLLKPLKYIKFPVHIISIIISIALRFIPTFLEEVQIIKKAQISRGANYNSKGLVAKLKSVPTIVMPMFALVFKKSETLSEAMIARGFVPSKDRTRYKKYQLNFVDISLFMFLIFILVFSILIKVDVIHLLSLKKW